MTQFTQKHYVAIAKVIARKQEDWTSEGEHRDNFAIRDVAEGLAVMFTVDNEKFDEDRFLKAAKVR